ncbi:MAG: SEC-C domain-containing protein, partial [Firmicutes bacterium]|nr:SEC-C domain-containing protein [Bacillota bacterium]
AQKKVEGRNFSARKYVLQYDNVMNKQREIIYGERRRVLFGEDLREHVMNMMSELVDEYMGAIVADSKYADEWDFETLTKDLQSICPRFEGFEYSAEEVGAMTPESLREDIIQEFERLYEEKEAEIGADRMRELERMILIRVVDNKWMDHIDAMDQLKNGIGLRGLGGVDPAAAYAQEGFDMFEEMEAGIKEETVRFCYNVTLRTTTERREVFGKGEDKKDDYVDDTAQAAEGGPQQGMKVPPREKKQETVRREFPKVGRNDPCPCGSGKKYKYCHGREQ